MQTLMFMKSLRTWDWEKSESESEKHSNEQSQRNDEQPPVHNKRASHFFQKSESKSDDNSEIKKNSTESNPVEKKKKATHTPLNQRSSLTSSSLSLSLCIEEESSEEWAFIPSNQTSVKKKSLDAVRWETSGVDLT